MAAFDPTKTSANITLSNGDKTVVANAAPLGWQSWQCSISDFTLTSASGGKWYWEMSLAGTSASLGILAVGICDQSAGTDFNKDVRVGWNESWALLRDSTDGFVFYHDGSSPGDDYSVGCSDGSVLMFAVDMGTGKFWAGVDGTWLNSGDPAAGTGQIFSDATIAAADIAACAEPVVVSGGTITAKFESADFAYTPPTGFSAPPASNEMGVSAGIGLAEVFHAENVPWGQAGFAESVGLEGSIHRNVVLSRGVSAGIGLDDTWQTDRIWHAGIAANVGLADAIGGVNATVWLDQNIDLAVYRFYASMSGGSGTYALPGMLTLQCRMRDGEASYLTITLPYSAAALGAIASRTDGQIIIEMAAYVGGVESLREELLRADYYSLRYDRGATNQSITLVGYQTRSYGGARTELRDVSMITMLADGRVQYRCAWPDFYLRPGDTAVYGADEFIVGSIMCVVSPVAHYMDVQEALT